jgi:hypothetical protein
MFDIKSHYGNLMAELREEKIMIVEQVKEGINATPKGANIIVEWNRAGKTRKGVAEQITKSVRMVGRIGIEYDNIGKVQAKRENGELPAENQGLKWGRYEIYPYLIEHKGNRYLRLYKGTSDKVKPKVVWYRNGIEVSRDEIAPLLLKSELQSKEGDCFCVNVEAITRLHTEAEIERIQEQVRIETEQEQEAELVD